jgi:hypothetical protein
LKEHDRDFDANFCSSFFVEWQMQTGDLVIAEGVRTLVEVCDVISTTRFTAYWLVGVNWRENSLIGAQMMDLHFERDVINGKNVLHLYDDVPVEVVGRVENGVYIIDDNERTISPEWY